MSRLAERFGLRPAEHRTRLLQETTITMRDGVRLRTRRVGPSDGRAHPTVLVRTPYGIGWTPPVPFLPFVSRVLARRGYHVVLQDTRGRYGSEGSFYPFVHEAEDGRDTLEWISQQPWCDGRVGMWGGSYFGYTQWAVAADPPPCLRALVPVLTTTDFHALFYPGGAFSLISALRWAAGNGERKGRRAPERRLPRAVRTRPIVDALGAVGREAPFFADWVEHRELDDYWERINHTAARASRLPTLLVAGTYDIFCGPQLEDFAARGEETCLDLGPFAHGSYAISTRRLGWRQAGVARIVANTLPFFDHHLQGRPLERARVRRYVQGEDRWRDEPAWPPPDAVAQRLYLRSGGRLDRESPGGDEAPDRFRYDPHDPVPTRGGPFLGPRCGPADQAGLEQRPDVLVYETAPLERALEVAGPVQLRLRTSSDAPATDFTGKLVHVPADGRRPALNLCEGIRRIDRSAGEGSEVRIDLWHTSARLEPGDRLRLEVSSSNFPRFDAHPNTTGHPGLASAAKPALQTLHHARDVASCLDLFVRHPEG
jgi:putative CocE/NonD family hydrolase